MEMAATVSTSKRKSSSAPVPPRDSSAVAKAASNFAALAIGNLELRSTRRLYLESEL